MLEKTYTIGQLAAAAGVGVETVRYYQRRELLEVPNSPGGIRRYSNEHVRRLGFIKKAQIAGFSLQEIHRLIELDASTDRAEAYALATQKLSALDAQIAELQSARAALAKLANDCAAKTCELCPILAAFDDGA